MVTQIDRQNIKHANQALFKNVFTHCAQNLSVVLHPSLYTVDWQKFCMLVDSLIEHFVSYTFLILEWIN